MGTLLIQELRPTCLALNIGKVALPGKLPVLRASEDKRTKGTTVNFNHYETSCSSAYTLLYKFGAQ
jgi:hypothetical protein